MNRPQGRNLSPAIATILTAGLIAGTLDATGAIVVYGPFLGKATVEGIFRGIASAIFRKRAMTEGTEMAYYGLLFHYLIAMSFAVFYFFIFPLIPFLRKHKVASGLIYGILAWCVMNLIVLPVAFSRPPVFHFPASFTGILLIMFLVGLPIALIIPRYYRHLRRDFIP
ncbi:MAG TPA: DUF1440 domain-containing protein [Puia sp.]|nr:DUF1440 domain-containing protein [Puia sp.]